MESAPRGAYYVVQAAFSTHATGQALPLYERMGREDIAPQSEDVMRAVAEDVVGVNADQSAVAPCTGELGMTGSDRHVQQAFLPPIMTEGE